MSKHEAMTANFAVFNLHVNDAGALADQEFVRLFGQKKFDRHIKRFHDEGIMSIFHVKPNQYQLAWVAMVAVLVNRNAKGAARYEEKVAS